MKTGDLKLDTHELKITIEKITEQDKTYFEAKDQYGNTETARTPERAEVFLRAKVDITRSKNEN